MPGRVCGAGVGWTDFRKRGIAGRRSLKIGGMTVYGFTAISLDGREVQLREYEGQVLLIVNTASRCGLTPQYAGLEQLYRKYKDRGFTILGFPCNQFGAQEPGTSEEIAQFCSLRYDVTFPLFEKIEVNGSGTHPLYKFLKEEKPGFLWSKRIKWNFTKFLVDRSGSVVRRFAPSVKPEAVDTSIAQLL